MNLSIFYTFILGLIFSLSAQANTLKLEPKLDIQIEANTMETIIGTISDRSNFGFSCSIIHAESRHQGRLAKGTELVVDTNLHRSEKLRLNARTLKQEILNLGGRPIASNKTSDLLQQIESLGGRIPKYFNNMELKGAYKGNLIGCYSNRPLSREALASYLLGTSLALSLK